MESARILQLSKGTFTLLTLLALTFLVSNCKKKDLKYSVSGTISDKSFNNNLAGATVELQLINSGNSSSNKTMTATTDASGTYSFTFDRDKFTSIELTISKNQYFSADRTLTLDQLTLDGNTEVNFDMWAVSWIKIHFTGDGTKNISYFKQQGLNNCAECCPSGEQFLYNVIDESIVCINHGNSMYEIFYTILDTNPSLSDQVGVVTTAFDTTDLNVSY